MGSGVLKCCLPFSRSVCTTGRDRSEQEKENREAGDVKAGTKGEKRGTLYYERCLEDEGSGRHLHRRKRCVTPCRWFTGRKREWGARDEKTYLVRKNTRGIHVEEGKREDTSPGCSWGFRPLSTSLFQHKNKNCPQWFRKQSSTAGSLLSPTLPQQSKDAFPL